jgi:diphthamide biosynthesis protein 3
MPLYDEIEIEDMFYDPETRMYTYPCPCGDRFKISLEDLWDGEDEAGCESCTLYIEVIYEEEDLHPLPKDDDDDDDDESIENRTNIKDTVDDNSVSKAMKKLAVSVQ